MLINRTAVKKLALSLAADRFKPINDWGKKSGYGVAVEKKRVSAKFVDSVEAAVRNIIREKVDEADKKGQTL